MGAQLLQQMRKLPGFTDVNSDQQNQGLQAVLVLRPADSLADWESPRSPSITRSIKPSDRLPSQPCIRPSTNITS